MHKEPVANFHKEVDRFKKDLIQATLEAHRGNRTHAARTLGLQRTYLLRLMRDFGVIVPISQRFRRDNTNGE